jgi:hypothetical protein
MIPPVDVYDWFDAAELQGRRAASASLKIMA